MRGLIYSYACHPTTLGPDNYYISADYPGIVRRILEEWHPGLVPVFLQGCGADIKPYITADNGRFKSCNFAELEQASQSLAADIENCLDQANWRKIEASLTTGKNRSDKPCRRCRKSRLRIICPITCPICGSMTRPA